MLWVYAHYKYINSYSAGIDFRQDNLTSADVRFWRLKSDPRAVRVREGHTIVLFVSPSQLNKAQLVSYFSIIILHDNNSAIESEKVTVTAPWFCRAVLSL